MLRMNVSAAMLFLSLFSRLSAYASSFDTFSDHGKLNGLVVVAAGDVLSFSPSPSFTSDVNKIYRTRVYKISGLCFSVNGTNGFSDDLSGRAALLLIDSAKNASIAEISSPVSQIKITLMAVTLIDCVDIIKQQIGDLNRNIARTLRESKRAMEALKQAAQPP